MGRDVAASLLQDDEKRFAVELGNDRDRSQRALLHERRGRRVLKIGEDEAAFGNRVEGRGVQRVSAINNAASPPKARVTTAITALAMIRRSVCISTLRVVTGQLR